jgi:uncharacterized membrane protein YhhN
MKIALALIFIAYLVLLGIDCLLILNQSDEYRFYTFPLLMPLLYVNVALETSATTHKTSKIIISLALLFGLAGGVLLINNTPNGKDKSYFTAGLICLSVVNILYTMFLYRIKRLGLKKIFVTAIAVVIVAVCLFFLMGDIAQGLEEHNMELAGWAYTISSGVLVIAASNTLAGKRAKRAGFANFVPGALLLFASVCIFCVVNFYTFESHSRNIFPMLNCAVAACFGMGQLAIISGAVKFIKK